MQDLFYTYILHKLTNGRSLFCLTENFKVTIIWFGLGHEASLYNNRNGRPRTVSRFAKIELKDRPYLFN